MMVEWRYGAPAKRLRKVAPKIVSRDMELLLKPEFGIELKGIYGCRSKETDIGYILRLGDVYKGRVNRFSSNLPWALVCLEKQPYALPTGAHAK